MTNTDLMLWVGFSIIFCALIFQIILSTKMIRLLKQQKIFHSGSKTEIDSGMEVDLKAVPEIEAEVKSPKNERLEGNFQDEIVITVLLKMFTIRNSVHKQISNIHVKSIENAPKRVGVEERLLSQSFSDNKLEQINTYWNLFNIYINSYWINKNGGFKTVFPGDIDKKTGEVGKMLTASERLLVKLDKLLTEFQRD